MSNTGNVVGGHKANLNNPNTSEESKQHSQDVIDELGDNVGANNADKNPANVIGGLKATTKNPRVSDEAKENATKRLTDEFGQ